MKYAADIALLKEQLQLQLHKATTTTTTSNITTTHNTTATPIPSGSDEYMLLQQEYYRLEEQNLQYEIDVDTLKQELQGLQDAGGRGSISQHIPDKPDKPDDKTDKPDDKTDKPDDNTGTSGSITVPVLVPNPGVDTIALTDKIIELQSEIFVCNDVIETHLNVIKDRESVILNHKTKFTK